MSYLLYRGPPGAGPLQDWETDLAEPLGDVEFIKQRINEIFPDTQWKASKTSGDIWLGSTFPDFQVSPEADGFVHTFTMQRARPDEVRKLASALRLSVFDQQSGGSFKV